MKFVFLFLIKFYQKFISPYKGFHCAYAKKHNDCTCSNYGYQVINNHGVVKGFKLLNIRFKECSKAAQSLKSINHHHFNKQAGFVDCGGCDGCDLPSCDVSDACNVFDACDIFDIFESKKKKKKKN